MTSTSLPCFWGDDNDHSARFHVMIFLSHMSQNNIQHEDHMMAMFAHSLQGDTSCWLHECFPEKSITSLAKFFEIFLKQWHYDGNDIESFNAKSFFNTNLRYFFPWKEFHTEYPKISSINMVYNNQHSNSIMFPSNMCMKSH